VVWTMENGTKLQWTI